MKSDSLSFYSERLLLLAVDPVSGRLFPVPEQVFHLALAGALLFDASFNGLVNDDWKQLTVLKTEETGYPALDEALRSLQICPGPIPLEKAIGLVAARGSTLRRLVWESLQAGGLLIHRKRNIVTDKRRLELFTPDLPLIVDMHKQMREALEREEIPDVRLPALFSLMTAGGLTKYILKPEESIRFEKKISWLADMESLGREIIRSVRALASTDLDASAAALLGLEHDQPRTTAGGMEAVLNALSFLRKETGLNGSRKLISRFNQVGGFECPGCAWPNPDKHRSPFEFCENGAKNVGSGATSRLIGREFFEKWPVQDLLLTPDYWLEQQGRLTEPMILEENATHYRPISWDMAFRTIADELKSLDRPDEAVFYVSGRTSNEAAFLYQLLARAFGTNNLPNSANLCHEPSGKALMAAVGAGKSSVTLDDFPKAECLFLFGHNPGSNHPRMLSALQAAVRKGCKIVAVNPMPEASLMSFADPQEPGTYFGKQTRLAHLFLQPKINGDMALIRGIVKALLEAEEQDGNVLDSGFIGKQTAGFEAYRQLVTQTPWDRLVALSGVERRQIEEAADLYRKAKTSIACWCLGITHHRNSVETIREIINLMLLKGNIGKPGAGVCPVRGHSNIQGLRTSGAGENMPDSFLQALEKRFAFAVPRRPGMSVIPSVKAMAEGKASVLFSLGGNLAAAVPDTPFVHQALRSLRLTVMISTKLNRSHLVTGRTALILPCLSRMDEDIRDGEKQYVTIEDAMGKIGFSHGCLPPASPNLRSEASIIAGIGAAALADRQGVDWARLGSDYAAVRTAMADVIPAFKDLSGLKPSTQGYYLENPLRNRVFATGDGKAHFGTHPLEAVAPEPGELLLMTVRSHDQFNTTIFGLNDRYRGIRNERRVLFMNREDMDRRSIAPEHMVEITSRSDGRVRVLEGYYAVPYPITPGCAAAYFPETNVLTSINNVAACGTPAYKAVSVQIKPAAAG